MCAAAVAVGIEKLAFYTSSYVLPLTKLAQSYGYEQDYYEQKLLQQKMAILPPSEDWISLAANALVRMLAEDGDGAGDDLQQKRQKWQQQLSKVGLLLFATESATEMSKSSASYLHSWFALPERCRIVELKQACYAGTAGLQLALDYLRQNPDRQVVLVASDVADYQIGSAAESSQGCGAVAMLLSANPALLTIEPESAYCAQHSFDFWHPNQLPYALVNGKLSCEIYLDLLERCWRQMTEIFGRKWHDFAYFCYHSPVPKLVYLAHRKAAKLHRVTLNAAELEAALCPTLTYAQQIGNCYTASLYLNLLSLWENGADLKAGDRVAMYSYGSGSIGELWSGRFNSVAVSGGSTLRVRLDDRVEVTLEQYRAWITERHARENRDSWRLESEDYAGGSFGLSAIDQGKRIYRFGLEEICFT